MSPEEGRRVRTGIEVLREQRFAPLAGRRIGLVTNPTGVLPDLRSTIETLARAPGVTLRALFGPEHGVRGDVPAGRYVENARDAATGLPVYSLYGRTQKPTTAMLKGLDALVFDLQDIGARSYTYLSTLGNVMDACAEHRVSLVVLDRPNPLGGERVEGSPAEPGFRSFVGKYPIPYLHGMTLGELARMINGEGWLPGGRRCELTVIACQNLGRAFVPWAATGLPWVPTSPHIPRPETAAFYAATGIAGELPTLSIGVGYTLPFELAGAPGIAPAAMARRLEARNLSGVRFRPASWTPFYAAFKGVRCGGVQIYLDDPARAPLTRINFEILDALRALDRGRALFTPAAAAKMFDLVCGTDRVRKAFAAGAGAGDLWAQWNAGRDAFLRRRQPYLLYR
jgi:uncharacterized protein YbbC (DUF1343 family)